VIVYNPSLDSEGQSLISTTPSAKFYSSFDGFLSSQLDGIIVASPDHKHYEQVAAAVGKHVATLVEKPAVCHLEQARDLAHLAAFNVCPVFVGYDRRVMTHYQEARRIVMSGQMGRPISCHCRILNDLERKIQQTDTILFNVCSHFLDAITWLLHSRLDLVSAAITKKGERDLRGGAHFFSDSGAFINISYEFDAWVFPDALQSELVICFERGTVVLDRVKLQVIDVEKGQFREVRDESVSSVTDDFVDYLVSNACAVSHLCRIEDDISTIELLERVYKESICRRE
jgi:predicted dehydrogenase